MEASVTEVPTTSPRLSPSSSASASASCTTPTPFCIRSTGYTTMVDAFGKEYIAYNITVRNGLLEWHLSKRFSQFAALHEDLKLEEHEPGSTPLPPLPPKRLLYQPPHVLQDRQCKLEAYLQALLDRPMAMENLHVLSFLGIVSSMRVSELASGAARTSGAQNRGQKPRQVLHVSALARELELGDLILFQCAHRLANLQRILTGAEWDHGEEVFSILKVACTDHQHILSSLPPFIAVALVVDRADGRGFDLLESTGDGVTCWPLSSRLAAYATEFTSYMAVRKLRGERTPDLRRRLHAFVEKVKGRPYGFPLQTLFAKKFVATSSSSSSLALLGRWRTLINKGDPPSESSASKDNHDAGFFCSNLVAAALQEAGVLANNINHLFFWPGAFTEGGEVDGAMAEGFAFGNTIMVDVSAMELGKASVVLTT